MKVLESFRDWLLDAMHFVDSVAFRLGKTEIRLSSLVTLLVLIFLLFYLTSKMKRWLTDRVLVRSKIDVSARHATATILGYVIIFFGLMVILNIYQIDLKPLTVVAGAVGVGIAFGLRDIANNFLSGLIILFERPIKLGDRIEVGDVEGEVVAIRARSSTVVTNDNVAIIIPNSKFMTENVINWSYTDASIRFKIPVQVAYGTDVRNVERALLEVAQHEPDVLADPAPVVRFMEFGDSGLAFELRIWTSASLHRPGRLVSNINFGIEEMFRKHEIEFPFPQRDIHLRGGSVDVRIVDERVKGEG